MLYENELVQYRTLKIDSANGLQIFAKPKNNIFGFKKYCQLLQRYATINCCAHGIHYLRAEHSWVRCVWALVVLLAVSSSITMYTILNDRHELGVLKTVVEDSRLPTYTIDFPAIAVCPFNHVNWMRFVMAEQRFLPPNSDVKTKSAFKDLVIALESLEFGVFGQLGKIDWNNDYKVLDKSVSIADLAQFLAHHCEDIFMNECIFNNVQYDCCKLFIPERTEKGICLVFNSILSPDSKRIKNAEEFYPRRASKAGEGSGLKFSLTYSHKVFDRPDSQIPFAVNLMIKEPNEFSETLVYSVYANTRNTFTIEPIFTVANNNTRVLAPEVRGCIFNNEKSSKFETVPGLDYNELNCRTQCMQKHLLKICNCIISHLFPHILGYSKESIEDRFIDDARFGMICDCVHSCESIDYLITHNAFPSPKVIRKNNESVPIIEVEIYFLNDMMTKYSTSLENTLMDLLACFGGSLSLFLGGSIMSFVELAYYSFKMVLLLIGDRRILWNKLKLLKFKLTKG